MANTNILTASSTDGAKTGVAITGNCTLHASGTFADGRLVLQASSSDGDYAPVRDDLGQSVVFNFGRSVHFAGTGVNYIRVVQENSTGSTSVKVIATQ